MKIKKIQKKLAGCALCGTLLVAAMGITSLATDTGSKSFSNVVTERTVHTTTNNTASSGTFSAGARGNVDTRVRIKKSNGTVITSKVFPANTSAPWLSTTVPSGQVRNVTVGSTSAAATSGTLSYTSTY